MEDSDTMHIPEVFEAITFEEVEAYKQSLRIGQELIYKETPYDQSKPSRAATKHAVIKAIYPYFVYTEEEKSLLYPMLMKGTGWLKEYREQVKGQEDDIWWNV